jgi:hypothetical protein
MTVFWDAMPCSQVDSSWRSPCPAVHCEDGCSTFLRNGCNNNARPHGVTSQKTVIFTETAVRTSDWSAPNNAREIPYRLVRCIMFPTHCWRSRCSCCRSSVSTFIVGLPEASSFWIRASAGAKNMWAFVHCKEIVGKGTWSNYLAQGKGWCLSRERLIFQTWWFSTMLRKCYHEDK